MQRILLSFIFLFGFTSQVFASQLDVTHNVARGLPILAQGQSIDTLKPFEGEFRILSTKSYTNDIQAKFSPIDYAVSWGLFADPSIAKNIHVRQYDRFLNWQMNQLPVPPKIAMQMVSNMHIIPANPEIAKQIQRASRGDLIRLTGELVQVKDGNMVWRSSLTNTDGGEGGCELFRVHSIQWIEKSNI